MHNRRQLHLAIISTIVALAGNPRLTFGQETAISLRQMRRASEAEQTVWIKAHLGSGMPPSETFGDLILNRSGITLPLIEQKIEEVLRSPSPAECFTDATVDPQNFVDRAASAITGAGDIQSLKEAVKLIKIDEKRFGWLVGRTLLQARANHDSFTLAYRAFELGDPAVESRTVGWIQEEFRERESVLPGDVEAEMQEVRGWLANTLVERYGAVPTESEWAVDPIISRLPPAQAASLHDDVMRAAKNALQRRIRR